MTTPLPAAELPDQPSGHELEEFFAALLQGTGHYVEKNIEDPNILELDIVATSHRGGRSVSRVFEVKGTEPRLGDIFKLLGRMTYLSMPNGAFVCTVSPRDRERAWFDGVCNGTGIKFIVCDSLAEARSVFKDAGFGETDDLTHAVWRFSYWLERRFVDVLRALARTDSPPPSSAAALEYYRLVNSGVFLTRDTLERVRKLYAAYQEHPRLTADLAEEMAVAGGGTEGSGQDYLRSHLYTGSHVELDATMYLEHRGRLAILQAATDYLREGGAVRDLEGDTMVIDLGITALPRTFLQGMTWLQSQPSYSLFPVYWQNLLWGWGGLIPHQHRSTVEREISEVVGLEPSAATIAQQAMDQLFPISKGWFRSLDNAAYRFVTLTPWPMQGIGAFHQMARAGHTEHRSYVPDGQYTATDFVRRQNAAVQLLQPT